MVSMLNKYKKKRAELFTTEYPHHIPTDLVWTWFPGSDFSISLHRRRHCRLPCISLPSHPVIVPTYIHPTYPNPRARIRICTVYLASPGVCLDYIHCFCSTPKHPKLFFFELFQNFERGPFALFVLFPFREDEGLLRSLRC